MRSVKEIIGFSWILPTFVENLSLKVRFLAKPK